MYTYTIKTNALAVEIEAPTIDAAAVTFGPSAGLSGNNCQEILEVGFRGCRCVDVDRI